MGEFFGILRRRIVSLLLVFVIVVLIAVGLYAATPKTYAAQSAVKIQPVTALGDTGASKDLSTTTEGRVAHSTAVAEFAAKALHFSGPLDTLLSHVVVSSPLNSQLLYIQYSASTPARAAAGANAFANAYLQYRKSVGQSSLAQQTTALTNTVAALQKELSQLPTTGPNSQRGPLQSRIDALNNKISTTQTTVIVPGQVVGVAQPPSAPSSPKKTLYLAGGIALGLLAGIIAAVVRDRRDDTLHGPNDAEEVVGAPVLASISSQAGDRRGGHVGSLLRSDVDPIELDAYRTIGSKLRAPRTGEVHNRFLVIGVGSGREPSAVVNLAITLAQQGLRTVLLTTGAGIDRAAHLFGDEPGPRGMADGVQAVEEVPGLSVLNLGPELALANVVNSRSEDIEDLLADADVTLVDAVSVSLSSSALTLGRLADVAVLVVDDRRSRHAEVGHAVRELGQVEVVPIGTVLFARPRGWFTRLRGIRRHRGRAVHTPAGTDAEVLEPTDPTPDADATTSTDDPDANAAKSSSSAKTPETGSGPTTDSDSEADSATRKRPAASGRPPEPANGKSQSHRRGRFGRRPGRAVDDQDAVVDEAAKA